MTSALEGGFDQSGKNPAYTLRFRASFVSTPKLEESGNSPLAQDVSATWSPDCASELATWVTTG